MTFPIFLLLSLIIARYTNSVSTPAHLSKQIYVVPFPLLDQFQSDGSLARPYSFIQQALDHVERQYSPHSDRISIHLYPTQYFVDTVHLTQVHSHLRLTTMADEYSTVFERRAQQLHSFQRLSTAVVSGGIVITNWTQLSGNTYSAVLPSLPYVNQLFLNNQRIARTRVPTNSSEYLHYAAPLNDSVQATYGFQYMPGQFDYKSLADAMVVVYHSWTESHHYVDRLITANDTILFTNPSQHPIGKYPLQGQRRFHIENLCEALVANSFCFVNETKTVYLMTNGSYDPRREQMITSVNDIVVSIAGNDSTTPVEDIIIDNIAIQHGAWTIDRYELAEAASAAFLTSFAVMIDNATSIVLSDIEISHTGSYALRIKEGTSNILLTNSLITDTGAGGIWVGHRTAQDLPTANGNKILSNEISSGGHAFPSAVGILVHRAVNMIIADNEVHHHRYIGISVGSQSGYLPVWTSNILIQGNYVHDIGQHILCDQGGIYILGIQPGTVVHGNVVKNVFSYSMQMWGIYLDDGASDIVVSNNVVYNSGWAAMNQHYGANNTITNNVFARASLIQPPHPQDPLPDGDVRISLTENHTSWIYTQNIVYDTYRGANHSAFKSDQANVSAVFNNNVYYNTHNTSLLFGFEQVPFSAWQKTGQDNNSVIADPLFAGDVDQCDFFTVQANSPAAKLGFVNLTKLTRWTPGCDTDSETVYTLFYHW